MRDFHSYSLFRLSDAYQYGLHVSKDVSNKISGVACGNPHDYGVLAQAIFYAGDGHYADIGTLFGASAIVAALIKKEYSIKGKVYCIDPLDGYYGAGKAYHNLLPSRDILLENAYKFDVIDILEIIEAKSIPYPSSLSGVRFSCSFIDGNHWGNAPIVDFTNFSRTTDKYLVFDNYDMYHPAVIDVIGEVVKTPEWRIVHLSSISLVLEKGPMIVDKFAGVI